MGKKIKKISRKQWISIYKRKLEKKIFFFFHGETKTTILFFKIVHHMIQMIQSGSTPGFKFRNPSHKKIFANQHNCFSVVCCKTGHTIANLATQVFQFKCYHSIIQNITSVKMTLKSLKLHILVWVIYSNNFSIIIKKNPMKTTFPFFLTAQILKLFG